MREVQKGIWEEHWKLPVFFTDAGGLLKLTSLSHLLQESAGNHADARKLGQRELLQKGQAWVLSRLLVQLDRPLRWKDELTIQTWVSAMKGPSSMRNFRILDPQGKEMGSAASVWVLIDLKRKRLVPVPENDLPVFPQALPDCGPAEKVRFANRPGDPIGHWSVRHADLDMLHHVNNVRYLEKLIDHTRRDLSCWYPYRVSLNYLGEVQMGSTLGLFEGQFNDRTEFRIEEEERVVVRAEVYWRERQPEIFANVG